MEKGSTIPSNKKKPDDSIAGEKDGEAGDGLDSKKDANAEKVLVEKDEVTPKNDVNSKKDSRSSTPSTALKTSLRSTRSSNNPEFVAKQRHFLQKVNQGVFYQSEEEGDTMVTNGSPSVISKRKRSVSGGLQNVEPSSTGKVGSNTDSSLISSNSPIPSSAGGSKPVVVPKKRKSEIEGLTRDIFCWVCHKEIGPNSGGAMLSCEVCPRVYHARCCHSLDSSSPRASSPVSPVASSSIRKGWACPECVKIMRAETMGTRSRAMQLISMDQLCTLLKHVLIRVRSVTGAEPFFGPVDLQLFPGYREFVANPMDLGLIDRNIRRRTYGSTEAFFAEMKWILHNSIIFNTQHSKLSSIARSMIKVCRQELSEIENCPDCYANAHTRKDNWFIEVCRRPHILLWAKLKGFPHWPAKAMRVNKEGCVDVRFFGAHDRAWVPAKDCFLYSEEMPAPPKNRKKNNLDGCIMEVEDHIRKLKEKFEVFVYASFRTVFDPAQEDMIIMKMLPKYQPLTLESPIAKPSRSPERSMSRDSPAISAGTEEESEEDQSLDGDEAITSKRTLDSPFEDSMEVPSGDASLLDTSTVSKSEADVKKEGDEKELEEKKLEEEDKKGDVEEAKDKEEKVEEGDVKEVKVVEEKAKEEKIEEDRTEDEKIAEENSKKEKDEEEKVEEEKVEKETVEDGKDEEDKVGKENEINIEDEERTEEAKEDVQTKEDVESRNLNEDIAESMEEDSQESVTSAEEADMVEEAKGKEGDEVEDGEKESKVSEKVNDEESAQESLLDETLKSDEKDQEMSSEIKDGKDEEVEDKDENDEFKKPSLEEDSMSSSDAGKLGKDSEESQEASGPGSVKSVQQIEENSILGDSKDSCGRLWANMPVDDDFRLSLSGNFSREILSDSLDNFNCEASFFVQSSTKQDEPAAKSSDEAKLDDEVEKSKITEEVDKEKDSEEEKAEEKGGDNEVSGEKRTEVADDSGKMEVETKSKDNHEIGEKDGADKVVEEGENTSISSETQEKIDVNKLRVSLMTKCGASSPSGPRDSPGLALPEKEAVLANALHPETGALIAVDDASEKVPVEEEVPKEDASPIVKESPKALVAAPINNKGDVGSQLSILGKLQQRLSFAKEDSDNEEVQEKDENTVDETESVAGDASSSSSEHEDDEEGAKKASKSDDKIKEIPSKENEEKITKDSVEAAASAETENVDKDVDKVPKLVEEAVLKTVEPQETTEEKKGDESKVKYDETEKVISEKEVVKEKDKAEEKVVEASNNDTADEDTSKTTEVAMEEQSMAENLCKRVESTDSTDKSDSTKDDGMDITSSKELTSEKETIGSESGRKASKAKTKPSESRSSEEDGPSIPKKQRISDEKNKVGTIQVKSKAALMGTKVENAVEEGVLNREVLKESNMVVVSKVVKSKRFEEEALTPPPAPKRARKGVAHKALIVDRSDSPGQDEVFPSMFLDPSVTITVLQESENGESKESPSNPPSSVVEELRTSVNLSNDVSLTMVRPTAPLEGLAAAQDVAFSRNTEQNSVDILGVPTTSPLPGTSPTFRPRARKSFPRPSQRISSRSPQPVAHSSSNADIKRLAQAVNGRDMSMAAMNAASPHSRTLSATLPSPSVSTRVASSQPSLPITSLAFSSSPTLSTASTSQPLVHSMVSQVMPSSTVMVTSTQASSPSTSSVRMPNLHPRPPSFPLSGPQPIYAPAEAGPVSAEFGKHAYKLANYMRGAIEDILGDLSRMGNSEAALKLLRLEIEKLKWEHQQEVSELKHNHDLMIVEMRNSLEKEKMRCVNEVRRHCEAEKMRAIEETKRKQWCANCSKEALFYCCWNTSYCDYPCQQSHWPRHMASCAQNNVAMTDNGEGDASNRKDGGTSGHKGLPSSAAPPPFHQLHRPGGSTQQESLPEEEYYDEDSNSPSAPRMGTSGGTYRVKRRRCGLCKGCLVKNNCGNCAPCRNSKTHQVCRMRRCRSLQSDWTPGGGGTSRPITPEPSLSVSLKTPPLTYASKKRKNNSKSPRLSAPPANLLASNSYGMANPQQNGDNHSIEMIAATADASDTQIVPFCGSLASQSRQLPPLPPPPHPQNQQKASTMDLSSQPIGHHMIHPHILSQAMTPYMYPNPYSQPASTNSESPGSASHSLPNYSRPPSYPQPPLLTQSSPSVPPPMPPLLHPHHPDRLSFPTDHSQCPQGCPSNSNTQTLPSHMPTQNGNTPRYPNPNVPPPLRKNGIMNGDPPPHPPSPFLPNPFLFPQFPQNPMLQPPYGQTANIRPPPPPTSLPSSTPKSRGRGQASKRNRSPYSRSRQPSPSPQPQLNTPFAAFLSSTSVVMGQQNHGFFFPGSCEIPPSSLAEQHQLHRQQMAAGVNMFSETMRFAPRPSYFV